MPCRCWGGIHLRIPTRVSPSRRVFIQRPAAMLAACRGRSGRCYGQVALQVTVLPSGHTVSVPLQDISQSSP